MKGHTVAFINGNIITMDPCDSRKEAIYIKNGIIEQLGMNNEILRRAGEDRAEVIDLMGKTVLPGLHDCHVHVIGTGLASVGTDLYDCHSVREVITALKKEADKNPAGWICGVRLDESRLDEKRPPLMSELDEAFPDRGVYILDRGLHYTLINRVVFDEIGLNGTEKGIGFDENGNFSGRMHEEANAITRGYFNNSMTKEQRTAAILSVEQEAARKGITTIHAMDGGEMFSDKDIEVFMELKDQTKIDFVLYWDTLEIEKVIKAGLPRIGTDVLSDGSIGSRTAAFDEPYADMPTTKGIMYLSDELMTEKIEMALKNHLQFGFHAIGQQAIRRVIDCYERAYEKYPWEDARFRMEHFGFCDDRDIERAKKNRMIISTQPSFSFLRGGPGSVYRLRTGEERERKAYPNRKFLEHGLVVAGGSDSNVTPMDSLLGIHSAVNHPYPEHRVSVHQALRMFTIDAAYAAFEEKKKGSLEKGKEGDLTILEKDPYNVSPDSIRDIKVMMTVKDGNIIFQQ